MKNVPAFDMQRFAEGLFAAGRKITENYIDNFSSYHHDLRDIFLTYSHFFSKLYANPPELVKVNEYYLCFLLEQQNILKDIFFEGMPYILKNKPDHFPDKRFRSEAWSKYPYFDFIRQSYLLASSFILKVVNEVELHDAKKQKLNFYTQQYINLLSPSNFLLTNPEALEICIHTEGASLWNGFQNFLSDLEKGKITQTDESAFQVGKNLAVTPGAVVYQNELMQLIQYTPSTEEVFEIPILLVPPWINKYYVLDMSAQNSFVKYLVQSGFRVFIISWKNPGPDMRHITFDDYVAKGILSATEVIQEITGSKKINTLGYCLGGTLLGIAASLLSTKEENPIQTVTFLAAMIDFTDIGPLGAVIDTALVNKLERGELKREGVLPGNDMEKAFNLIRVNDLVWKYAVHNYLEGQQPEPFDVLYWTNDNTNLPADMYLFYMKRMILGNKLSQKNALHICGTPIDIGKIRVPVFAIGLKDDYISPPETVFTTTRLVSGPVEFILGESGHVMGVVNPPPRKKYGHYVGGKPGYDLEEWLHTASFIEGSWWPTWSEKLKENSGLLVKAHKIPGNRKYKVIEPAPGTYVQEKYQQYEK